MTGYLIYGLANIFAAGFFYERRITAISKIYYFFAALNIALNFILIPILGVLGAVLTTVITYGSIPWALFFLSKKYFKISLEWMKIFKLAAILILIGSIENLVTPSFFTKFGLLVLFIFLVIFAVFDPAERNKLRGIVTRN